MTKKHTYYREFPIISKSGQCLCLGTSTSTQLSAIFYQSAHSIPWFLSSMKNKATSSTMPTRKHRDFCVAPTEEEVLPKEPPKNTWGCQLWLKYFLKETADLTAVIPRTLSVLDKYTLLLLQNDSTKLEAKNLWTLTRAHSRAKQAPNVWTLRHAWVFLWLAGHSKLIFFFLFFLSSLSWQAAHQVILNATGHPFSSPHDIFLKPSKYCKLIDFINISSSFKVA